MLDLRIPSGLFFGLLGIILTILSAVSPDLHAPLTVGDVNLYSGIFMILFGMVLLYLAKRSRT